MHTIAYNVSRDVMQSASRRNHKPTARKQRRLFFEMLHLVAQISSP